MIHPVNAFTPLSVSKSFLIHLPSKDSFLAEPEPTLVPFDFTSLVGSLPELLTADRSAGCALLGLLGAASALGLFLLGLLADLFSLLEAEEVLLFIALDVPEISVSH